MVAVDVQLVLCDVRRNEFIANLQTTQTCKFRRCTPLVVFVTRRATALHTCKQTASKHVSSQTT